MGVQARLVRDRFARVFGGAGQLERFGPVEGRAEADFADFFAVDLWRAAVVIRCGGVRGRERDGRGGE